MGEWTDDQLKLQLELVRRQLSARGLSENSVESIDKGSPKQPEEGLSTFPNEDSLFESPEKVDDGSPVSSLTSWGDFDET